MNTNDIRVELPAPHLAHQHKSHFRHISILTILINTVSGAFVLEEFSPLKVHLMQLDRQGSVLFGAAALRRLLSSHKSSPFKAKSRIGVLRADFGGIYIVTDHP